MCTLLYLHKYSGGSNITHYKTFLLWSTFKSTYIGMQLFSYHSHALLIKNYYLCEMIIYRLEIQGCIASKLLQKYTQTIFFSLWDVLCPWKTTYMFCWQVYKKTIPMTAFLIFKECMEFSQKKSNMGLKNSDWHVSFMPFSSSYV